MSTTSVFLARCDEADFERTVLSPVDTSGEDAPESLAGESMRLWRIENGTSARGSFEDLESGDLVLFYRGDEYVGTARIEATVEDDEEWASEAFWETNSPLVVTLRDVTEISVPKAVANGIFEYSDGYNPGALTRVADGRVENTPAAIELALERYSA